MPQVPHRPESKDLPARLQETLLSSQQVSTEKAPSQNQPQDSLVGLIPLPIRVDAFTLTEILAKGGMSLTFLGHLTGFVERKIVLKIPLHTDPETFRRFHSEMQLLCKLRHPGIVAVRGTGAAVFNIDGKNVPLPWIALDFISGQSLRQRITTQHRLPWEEVRKIIKDVAEALTYLAEQKVCHRDIKPDNLLHDPLMDRWVLVDFGIAKNLVGDARLALTLAGQDPGSWNYMSPEQLDGNYEVDTRSDIYSLGKTAWESLIGHVPRVGTAFPSALLGKEVIPDEVDLLIAKMVTHRLEERFQTPGELLQTLEIGAGRVEGRSRRKKVFQRVMRIGIIVLLLLSGLGGGWYLAEAVAAREVNALVREHKNSPTHATVKIREFLKTRPWIGRIHALNTLNELKPLAKKERGEMNSEYKSIVADCADPAKKPEYRLARIDGFLKKYQEPFESSTQVKDLLSRHPEVEKQALAAKELNEAEEVVRQTEDLIKAGQYRKAVDLCKEKATTFKTEPARKRLEQRRGELADRQLGDKLTELDALAGKGGVENILRAQDGILELQKTVGATPETTIRLKRYDRYFWSDCLTKVDGHLERSQFNQALAMVQFYLDNTRVKAHTTEVATARKRIKDREETKDFETISASAEMNLKNKAFALARKDVENYLTKWSTTKLYAIQANTLKVRIQNAHYLNIKDIKDLKDFNTELAAFITAYPMDTIHSSSLKKNLCYLSHDLVYKIVTDSTTTKEVKLSKLREIDYSRCEPDKVAYMRNLLERARQYLDNATSDQWYWYFMHLWYKAPTDCVKFEKPSTIQCVLIKSIQVSMSNKFYNDLKGIGDADPRIDIFVGNGRGDDFKQRGSHVFKMLGPKNSQTFTMTKNNGKEIVMWVDTKVCDNLLFRLENNDLINLADHKGFTIFSTSLTTSTETIFKWSDGTSMKITWSVE